MNTTNNLIRNVVTKSPKIALVFIMGLLCASGLLAQRAGGNGTIHGRIYDADTNRYMDNAIITIEGSANEVVSEQGGFYVIGGVPAGEVSITVNYAGYVTQRRTVTVAAGGRATADFEMRLTPATGPIVRPVEDTTATIPGTMPVPKEEVITLDRFTVTTQRAGNARAFMEQKNSMTMSTVLATDSYGTVPNDNIAEFLRNMPGLSALEDDETGEADQISIGGMDPSLTGVYMDGARQASGAKGTFGLDDSGNDSRSFRFDQISINGIESIEVRRTVSADMEGDAPAGGVSMRTKSAFDNKRPQLRYDVYFTANSYAMDFKRTPGADDGKSLKYRPGFNLTYSTPFYNGAMGLVVSANAQTDFRETNRVDATPQGDLLMVDPYLNNITYRNTQTQSERMGASIRWDWRINPFASLKVRYGYAKRDTTTFNRNVIFEMGRNANPNTSNLVFVSSPEADTATQNRIDQTASFTTTTSNDVNITFNWKRYGFNLEAIASFSESEGEKDPSNGGTWFTRLTMYRSRSSASSSYALWGVRSSTRDMDWSFYRGDRATFTVSDSDTAQIGDIGTYRQSSVYAIQEELPSSTKETIPSLKVDLRWDAPTKFPLWFKTGVNMRETKTTAWQPQNYSGTRLRNNYQYTGNVGVADPDRLGTTGANYDAGIGTGSSIYNSSIPLLSSSYYVSDYKFDPHFDGNITSLNVPMIDLTRLYSAFRDHFVIREEVDAEGYVRKKQDASNWFYQNPADVWNDTIANWTARRNLKESILAGYLMGEVRPWKNWVFQAGVRYEYTEQEATTLIPSSIGMVSRALGTNDSTRADFLQMLYRNGERTTTTNSYSFVLPSGAIKYSFTPNLVAHLGYSEGFGRVSVDKLASNWKVTEGSTNSAKAPNPNLEPDHYKTYSASIEYYFEPAGSFTFTYTYRQWTGTTYEELLIDSANVNDPTPELANLISLYGRDTIETFLNNDYLLYTWQPSELNDRSMQTLEFSYRQRIPAIPGLQVDANFTRNVPNWRKSGAASAPKLASGGVSYSRGNLFVRVSGNWRDRYWQQWPLNEESVDYKRRIGVHARFLLNAEVTYKLSRWLSFYATASNILNSSQTQYRNSPSILSQETTNGVSFRFGVKGGF